MIVYDPFFRTLREKKISTYYLIHKCNVSNSLLDRLRHNKPIRTQTIDDLCKYLQCNVDDILMFVPDEK